MAEEKSHLPAYLRNNSWEEELNYKLWTTAGSRFRADKRCKAKARWSQLAVTLLTSYIIIIGIIPLLPKPMSDFFPSEILAFTTTAVSILLLAYSIIEAAENYPLKAYRFHECGTKVAKLYADLRQEKTATGALPNKTELGRVSTEYQHVLEIYENHEAIDYATFKTAKCAYFKLNRFDCWKIWIHYYLTSLFVYHVIILFPPVLMFVLYHVHN